jgi:hypothetical protein
MHGHRASLGWIVMTAAVVVVLTAGVAGAAGAADERIARRSVLTTRDVPQGFSATAPSNESDPAGVEAACASIRRGRLAMKAAPNHEVAFRTPTNSSQGALIDNKVAVFAGAKAAARTLDAYAAKTSATCFKNSYEQLLRSQVSDPKANVEVGVERFDPGLGDDSTGYKVSIYAGVGSRSQRFFVNIQLVRVGRGIDAFGFFNTGREPPAADVRDMTTTGVARLTHAL